jgi:ribulose bisphosphate carboxylase small subunit
MFEWRKKNTYSNVIRKNGFKYYLYHSHTDLCGDYKEEVYYLLENGYAIRSIIFEDRDESKDFSRREILEKGNEIIANLSTCENCGEVKVVRVFDGISKCTHVII